MPFQTTMFSAPAPGIEGDWCSSNPRFSQLSQGAPLFAGPGGITVGRFAWQNGNIYSQPFGGGRIAFIHRDQPSLLFSTAATDLTTLLPAATMKVPQGLEVVGYDSADVWCKFAGGATPGQKVYAKYADGTALAAATGTPATIATDSSGYTIVAKSPAMSMTGSIAGNLLTITAATTGVVYPGTILSGAGGSNGVAVITGTMVLAQITPLLTGETQGGVGRYLLNYDYGVSSVQSSVITGVAGLLTITASTPTTWAIGMTLTASSLGTPAIIYADSSNGLSLTGAGGLGTYIVNGTDITASGDVLTGATTVETNWYVDTYAGTNELAKISRHG